MTTKIQEQEFKQTEIGEIPEDWDVKPFRVTCSDFFSGGTPPTKNREYWDGNIPWTTSAYITNIFLKTGQRNISRLGLDNSSSHIVPAGNLLVGTRVGVGKVAVNLIDIAISQDLTGCIVNKDEYDSKYLTFALMAERCQQFFANNKRGATIKGIPREDVLALLLPLPKKQEQQKIAFVLSEIQKAVETQEKIVANLRELKAATMAKLFREGTRGEPLKQTKIGEIPQNWDVATIANKYIFTCKSRDIRFSEYEQIPFLPMDMMPFNGRDIINYVQKAPAKISSGTYFEENDLLVSKITPCFENGKQGIARNLPGGFGMATTEVIPVKEIRGISDIYFLSFYLLEPNLRQRLAGKMEGATGRQRLDKTLLESWKIPFPKVKEQKEISSILLSIQSQEQHAEAKAKHLKSLFTSTLHLLMTGKARL